MMSAEDKMPSKTEAFLEWLDKLHPHRCPDITDTLDVIHRYGGARDLIDGLLCRWRQEQEEGLEDRSQFEI